MPKLTPGKLGAVREVSLEIEPRSSNTLVYDVRDKLKTYYFVMTPEEPTENIFMQGGRAKKLGKVEVSPYIVE